MSSQLSGETAIVTGSSKGIGKGIAERFADEGANVVVNSRSQERADEVAAEIRENGGTAVGIEADVTDEDAMEALVETTVEEFGSVDVMVNNAGMTILGEAAEFDVDDWRHVIEVDLVGTFVGCQAAGRQMIEQGDGGAILNMSSLMGGRGLQLRSPYCASKAGVNNLTQTLAVEWAEHDIHVNALAPGFIWTEITEQTQGSAGYTNDDIRDRTPLNRFGTVEEMAECALFLVGQNNFVTGEVLYADGGWQAYGWGAGDQ
ncbi:NAD(P)-dependent dehydrogenase, short-chain alcohol dehydrogenase family [Halogranum gelatinilyticum]|uniref:NAD(P)-dependent dehydrogenase, short-chain alcohol dehydrogenase family n=1 Tax=Halogranum gelatinilyticum TaxID=660521 RepID=A0A1G9ZQV1_9EURY|nr:SDR family NAD(P)-dependent oxidoreductase [Halogranum gelatinilyticum]SDN23600.1 NAD(P)-dependent dehydrogenase, short-chain alcohol dehydrogenase family [Halogranum gelatinilyticum]